jgi:hypothetical protein
VFIQKLKNTGFLDFVPRVGWQDVAPNKNNDLKAKTQKKFTKPLRNTNKKMSQIRQNGLLIVVVRLPGFEPESSAWEADVLPN